MKTKRVLSNISPMDQVAVERELERMAAKGWMIQKMGAYFWTYTAMEPKHRRFSVTYFPKMTRYAPLPTPGQQFKEDLCAEEGWTLALRWETVQIFYTDDPEATPVETEPEVQVENLYQALRSGPIWNHKVMLWLIGFLLAFLCFLWSFNPVALLANGRQMGLLVLYVVAFLWSVWELFRLSRWHKKAQRAAEQGRFLPVSMGSQMISWGFMLLLVLAVLGPRLMGPYLILLAGFIVLFWLQNYARTAMRNREMPEFFNFVLTTALWAALIFLVWQPMREGVLDAAVPKNPNTEQVYVEEIPGQPRLEQGDLLPREMGELADIDGTWMKKVSRSSSFLAAQTTCRHESQEGKGHLRYTVSDIKADFIYDYCADSMLHVQPTSRYYKETAFQRSSFDGCDALYQKHLSGESQPIYRIFYPTRLVELECTQLLIREQLELAVERLAD